MSFSPVLIYSCGLFRCFRSVLFDPVDYLVIWKFSFVSYESSVPDVQCQCAKCCTGIQWGTKQAQWLTSKRLLGKTAHGKYWEVPHNPGFLGNVVVCGSLPGESLGLMFQAGGAAYAKYERWQKAWCLQQLVIKHHWSSSVANTNVAPERVKEITIRDLHLLPLGTSNIYELT